MAVYFPRGKQSLGEIRKKFIGDHGGVARNRAVGMAFVTNQELTLGERKELTEAVDTPVDILHLERVALILDKPAMHPIREQYLAITRGGSAPPAPVPTPSRGIPELRKTAIDPPGAGQRNLVYDGMLALRIIVAPVPADLRHPDAGDPRAALVAASEAAVQITEEWPENISLLARRLDEGWRSLGPHRWGAGRSSEDAEALAKHDFAAAAFTTQRSVLCVDRTWATGVRNHYGEVSYYAAREAHVAGELLISLRLGAALLQPVPGLEALDVVIQIAGAPRWLIANERAAGPRFEEPEWHEQWEGNPPPAEVPSHHLDNGRFTLEELNEPSGAARSLLGPWLATFRGDDLLARLRGEASSPRLL